MRYFSRFLAAITFPHAAVITRMFQGEKNNRKIKMKKTEPLLARF
jgi:hypothetical protein